jgi:Zn-dependent protease
MTAGLVAAGNFTAIGVRQAAYMLISLTIAMSIREFARAWTATRLHDPTPRLWGRLTLNPKAWFEAFGSGLVPVLLAILWAVGVYVIPAAYAKPAPVDPSYFRKSTRDTVLVSVAGPLATLALGILAGLVVRAGVPVLGQGALAEPYRFAVVFTYTSMALVVFHLLPIPGLDGARIVALLLPPAPREVYRNADKYLPLFVLVVLFVFSTLVLGFLTALTGALCNAAAGGDCQLALLF